MFPWFECPHHFHPIPIPGRCFKTPQVLEVRRRFPRCSVAVALEVLRRNDEDPHAACEMLEEFRQRIRRSVSAEWDHFLHQGEVGRVGMGMGWTWGDEDPGDSWEYLGFLMIHMILRPWKLGDRKKSMVMYNYIYIYKFCIQL